MQISANKNVFHLLKTKFLWDTRTGLFCFESHQLKLEILDSETKMCFIKGAKAHLPTVGCVESADRQWAAKPT